jgi:type I restriction enzyme S subunit
VSELPKGWILTKFGNVLFSLNSGLNGKQNKVGDGIPVSRIETIANQRIDMSRIGFLKDYDVDKIEKYRLHEGNILFSNINSPAHLGKTALCEKEVELYHGVNLLRLTVNEAIIPSLLNYYCKYIRGLGEFSARAQHAVNQSSLNQTKLKDFDIPLAPLNEQIRIADKLNSMLAKVDAAQVSLDKIPYILKRFRQSVLAAATSGELTKEWREKRKLSLSDWTKSTLSEVATTLDPNPSHRYPKADVSGVPILSTQQFVGESGWTTDKAKLVNREFFEERKSKTGFYHDDIIFARKGRLGLARYAPKKLEYVLSHTVFIIRPGDSVDSDFILLFLKGNNLMEWLIKEMNSNTGVPTLGKGVFEKSPIAVPTIKEQKEIVRRVESLFAMADTVEKKYNDAKAKTNRLTQSILAKAFRGELVLQDENDEPASELLARIKEQAELLKPRKKAKK